MDVRKQPSESRPMSCEDLKDGHVGVARNVVGKKRPMRGASIVERYTGERAAYICILIYIHTYIYIYVQMKP